MGKIWCSVFAFSMYPYNKSYLSLLPNRPNNLDNPLTNNLPLNFAQYFPVNIKRAEWYDTGKQHFPCGGAELPVLLNSNTQGIENE